MRERKDIPVSLTPPFGEFFSIIFIHCTTAQKQKFYKLIIITLLDVTLIKYTNLNGDSKLIISRVMAENLLIVIFNFTVK